MKRTTPVPFKPGAEKAPFRPDRIVTLPAPAADGEQLLPFLTASQPQQKRTTLKEMLKYGQVMVDGQVTRQWDQLLAPGALVQLNYSRPFVVFYNRRLKLVYEDQDILVVNKGYGLLSMGTDKIKEGTAYAILRDYLKTKDPSNKLFIVHRLDQHTSGLMLFAKTQEAKEAMQHNWNNMVLERKYVCVVEGKVDTGAPGQSQQVRSYLSENAQHIVYSTPVPAGPGSQLAVTRYRALRQGGGYTLLEVQLATGRKNQIRVHMASLGHPVAGDRKYGATSSPIHRLALHAMTLVFAHPVTRRKMEFSTPIPSSFNAMVAPR